MIVLTGKVEVHLAMQQSVDPKRLTKHQVFHRVFQPRNSLTYIDPLLLGKDYGNVLQLL